MYRINGNDLYRVVVRINRLPDKYVKNGNMYDGIYNYLTQDEIKKISFALNKI